jgi:acyl-coenzyme A synthetase/AMP-(fatty) acid ligase
MISLSEHCLDLLAIAPAREAVQFEGRWYSWGDIRRLANELWDALAASGIGKSAPVTLVARNQPSALAAIIALLAEGRTIRMVYAFQSATGIAKSLARLGSPAAIMVEDDFSPEVREVLLGGRMAGIVLGDMFAKPLAGFEQGVSRAAEAGEGQACVEVLTSGTTGAPKQFPLPQRVISEFIESQRPAGGANDDGSEPPLLLTFPIGNIAGIFFAATSILRGKPTILLDRFSIEAWRAHVMTYRPGVIGAPTAAISMILDAGVPPEDLASLKYLITGAAPLDPVVHRAFEQRYGIPILLSYGATEFGGPVAAMTPELHAAFGDRKLGSVGRPLPGVKLRVIEPDTDEVLGAGSEGLLEVISPRIGPHWIRTSDIGVIDDDGFFWHRGRADGAIMRCGFKVLPETIERALLRHPAVSAAAVVGVDDERLQQVPAAAIQLKPGATVPAVEELAQHLRGHVFSTHIPVHWKFVEMLPVNRAFKIDRQGLKEMFEAGQGFSEAAGTRKTANGQT